jgi:hypothetical protein
MQLQAANVAVRIQTASAGLRAGSVATNGAVKRVFPKAKFVQDPWRRAQPRICAQQAAGSGCVAASADAGGGPQMLAASFHRRFLNDAAVQLRNADAWRRADGGGDLPSGIRIAYAWRRRRERLRFRDCRRRPPPRIRDFGSCSCECSHALAITASICDIAAAQCASADLHRRKFQPLRICGEIADAGDYSPAVAATTPAPAISPPRISSANGWLLADA